MPYRHNRGSTAVSRGRKRETLWFGFTPAVNGSAGAGGTIIYSLNAAALALRPFTIVRTVYELYITSDQTANTEDQVGAFGWCVVSDQAVAIGITAVPTPITDMSSDLWFSHQVCFNSIAVSSAVSVLQVGTKYSVDSRAMRKVEEGSDVIGVQEFSAVGAGFNLMVGGRLIQTRP